MNHVSMRRVVPGADSAGQGLAEMACGVTLTRSTSFYFVALPEATNSLHP